MLRHRAQTQDAQLEQCAFKCALTSDKRSGRQFLGARVYRGYWVAAFIIDSKASEMVNDPGF